LFAGRQQSRRQPGGL
jgi:hypothetical protein